jgi:hypothetical protein
VCEPRFVCSACGKRGIDVWPDFSWNKSTVPMIDRSMFRIRVATDAARRDEADRRRQ